jgi:O-antigen ligase
MLSQYLNRVEVYNLQGSTYADIGRVAAVQLGWSSLQKDLYTFIFGYGIGSRSESKTLGAAGVALTGGYLGWSVGTSLLVFMQEMGVLGLTSFFAFILWINVSMVREMRKNPFSTAFGIRVAVLMFSSLWPIWLFYAVTWTMRVPMLLYWFILGYVFAESQMPILGKSHRPH